jgi:hypothetical protein
MPTPDQERKAILAFIIFAVLTILGAGALLFGTALALGKLAQWVFAL